MTIAQDQPIYSSRQTVQKQPTKSHGTIDESPVFIEVYQGSDVLPDAKKITYRTLRDAHRAAARKP